ncbi:MAG TPA: histidine kinase [Sinomonas sp.]|nr:histidine kinase [Sinomonas sp.]
MTPMPHHLRMVRPRPATAAGPGALAPRTWELALDVVAVLMVIIELYRELTLGVSVLGLVRLAVAAGCVGARRKFPVSATVVAAAAGAAIILDQGYNLTVWTLVQICLFSVPLRRSRSVSIVLGIVVCLPQYLFTMAVLKVGPLEPTALISPLWTAAVLGIGLSLRSHQNYISALNKSAQAALDARESDVMHRMAEERLRIARDLHDAVAHNVAVINVHAGALERILPTPTSAVQTSLTEIRNACRNVLTEMQDILAILRRTEDEPARTPTNAVSVPALIDSFRGLGMELEGEIDLEPPLNASSDAALYRIIQEGLTNAHRYGTGAATVHVYRSGEQLRIDIDNAVAPGDGSPESGGFGLIGMRERTVAAGGTFDAERRGQTFVIRAALPLAAEPTEQAEA